MPRCVRVCVLGVHVHSARDVVVSATALKPEVVGSSPRFSRGVGVEGRRARLNHRSILHLTRIELVTFSVLDSRYSR